MLVLLVIQEKHFTQMDLAGSVKLPLVQSILTQLAAFSSAHPALLLAPPAPAPLFLPNPAPPAPTLQVYTFVRSLRPVAHAPTQASLLVESTAYNATLLAPPVTPTPLTA